MNRDAHVSNERRLPASRFGRLEALRCLSPATDHYYLVLWQRPRPRPLASQSAALVSQVGQPIEGIAICGNGCLVEPTNNVDCRP